ncbi:hypothetical protein AVEN_215764-1 [Araneus ventricosus]|uniref:Uncharacterized protein n=1 Tax=Araneus ventricosus TaxID=182803 RepID=A0A4Y2JPN3_ARAVE|nr:hypothetical protein AVEN_215764-1 [Araneus ventricosus]
MCFIRSYKVNKFSQQNHLQSPLRCDELYSYHPLSKSFGMKAHTKCSPALLMSSTCAFKKALYVEDMSPVAEEPRMRIQPVLSRRQPFAVKQNGRYKMGETRILQ